MKTLLVWYFLAGHSTAITLGPFTTLEQCEKYRKWSYDTLWNMASPCWQAPLAVPQQYPEECHAKGGCD